MMKISLMVADDPASWSWTLEKIAQIRKWIGSQISWRRPTNSPFKGTRIEFIVGREGEELYNSERDAEARMSGVEGDMVVSKPGGKSLFVDGVNRPGEP